MGEPYVFLAVFRVHLLWTVKINNFLFGFPNIFIGRGGHNALGCGLLEHGGILK